jgi:predicted RNase H-like HicB family nuclease
MIKNFILDYWIDDGWYIGKLREIPGIFSQGETFEELIENIKDAFKLMLQEATPIPVREVYWLKRNLCCKASRIA